MAAKPSWKIRLRLNRQYKKGVPGLLLPIRNLTLVGFPWRLRVVYSRGFQSKAVFAANANRPSPKTGQNLGVFGPGDPLKVNFKAPSPQKVSVQNRTRRLSHQACESVQNCDLCARRGNGKKGRIKGTKVEPISTIFGMFVGFADVITCAKNGSKISNDFSMSTGGKMRGSTVI